MTKGKKIVLPATVIECPEMKIFSVRFYNKGLVNGEVVVSNDKELKRVLRTPKSLGKLEDFKKEYDNIRVIVYVESKKDLFKKTPDLLEVGLSGTKEEKLSFVAEKIGKAIRVSEVFPGRLIDIRGITKGKGLQGPVKRFGISYKQHKSEKGVKRPGSLGPWHPARVTFRVSQAGQTGFNTRIVYNSLILDLKATSEKDISPACGFHKYGRLRGDYLIVIGSVQGPAKRQILLTKPLRATKDKLKRKYTLLELR
jgi:large subunit ribosomal protein L3